MSGESGESQVIVPAESLRKFIVKAAEKVGARSEHAQVLAELLVSADQRGHYSHGMNRLGKWNNHKLVFHAPASVLCLADLKSFGAHQARCLCGAAAPVQFLLLSLPSLYFLPLRLLQVSTGIT
ncbi:malate dehydrogenase [Plakobranchus ocellatus]|uniref:Malate dehydrogenase n=1 Tax=Plakobranchus ocellatus TaxID=259542 RepID=A0AAV4AV73_9GAST|nr:malate dehydrogenase [Plakobranchus ocellatus]